MENTQTPILKKSRVADAVTMTMREILMKDILTRSEMAKDCTGSKELEKLDVYLDYMEYTQKVLFNLSINDEKAFDRAEEFEMYLVSGRNNDSGRKPLKICGVVEQETPDTFVSFKMPVEGTDVEKIFSEHLEGYSYVNYAIYSVLKDQQFPAEGSVDARERLIMCKGKIYKTNILMDYTENILDGQ